MRNVLLTCGEYHQSVRLFSAIGIGMSMEQNIVFEFPEGTASLESTWMYKLLLIAYFVLQSRWKFKVIQCSFGFSHKNIMFSYSPKYCQSSIYVFYIKKYIASLLILSFSLLTTMNSCAQPFIKIILGKTKQEMQRSSLFYYPTQSNSICCLL